MRQLTVEEMSIVSGGYDSSTTLDMTWMVEAVVDTAFRTSGGFEGVNFFSSFFGLGGGFAIGTNGDLYLEVGAGTPGIQVYGGYTTNLNDYLTGTSATISGTDVAIGFNSQAIAVQVGNPSTPGASLTYGWDLGNIYGAIHDWIDPQSVS